MNYFIDYLKDQLKEQQVSRKLFVARLKTFGYKNVNKAYRFYDQMLKEQKMPNKEQVIVLSKLLGKDKGELFHWYNKEIEVQQKRKDEEMRKKFKPRVFAVCERYIPSPIFVGIMSHPLRFVKVPADILDMTVFDQLELIKEGIQLHFKKRKGEIPAFSTIKHYVYQRYCNEPLDKRLVFDTKGELIIYHNFAEKDLSYPQDRGLSVKGRKINI